jgi:hypothetical protein
MDKDRETRRPHRQSPMRSQLARRRVTWRQLARSGNPGVSWVVSIAPGIPGAGSTGVEASAVGLVVLTAEAPLCQSSMT